MNDQITGIYINLGSNIYVVVPVPARDVVVPVPARDTVPCNSLGQFRTANCNILIIFLLFSLAVPPPILQADAT